MTKDNTTPERITALAKAMFEHDQRMGLVYDGVDAISFYEGEARWADKLGFTPEMIRKADAGA